MDLRRHLLPVLGLAGVLVAARDMCPELCSVAGPNPSNWTVVAEFGQLQACRKTLVLDFAVHIPVTVQQQIRVCAVWGDDFGSPVSSKPSNTTHTDGLAEEVTPSFAWTPATSEDEIGDRLAHNTIETLGSYLLRSPSAENRTIIFGTASDITVGVYVGAHLRNPSVAESFFNFTSNSFLAAIHAVGIADSKSALLQVCENRTADETFGLIAASSADFAIVHDAVAKWNNGSCVDTSPYAATRQLSPVTLSVARLSVPPTSSARNSTLHETPFPRNSTVYPRLRARADCRSITVSAGNGCWDLASRCGISQQDISRFNSASNFCSTLQPDQTICCSSGTLPKPKEPEGNSDGTCITEKVEEGDDCGKLVSRCGRGLTPALFYKYNEGKSNLCATLQPGQRVCCTQGKLPDIRPKKNSDGTCFAYKIQQGDFCAKVAANNGFTVEELEKINKNTWGWNGCENGFWPDNWICLSDGEPPFPAPIANAVCGPQKLGSKPSPGMTSRDWAKLNECPLRACCNVWGQCGTTADFCIDTNTGPPGTAKKGSFGCISNCGMSLIRSPSPPAQFIKLGYFEAWSMGRKCLQMDVQQIDPSYTHIHFAFAMLTDKFDVYFEDKRSQFQFERFKSMRGPKRIISFGGWEFSAEAPNYRIFREGVKSAEARDKLANNLVKFVVDNDLDGLDIDWEYPAAPNLGEGVPKGDDSESLNYLLLLANIRKRLPMTKSLSIAAPASYWYLKQFLIREMSFLLDYIVYMTYDLHGQWDAGNQWATPGCPTGNCLRSHVNRTLTMNALTMITKAGVPSNKILVGVSSYGRSFRMADPGCAGPDCFYLGNRRNSEARQGRCTGTAGYISNAEMSEIGSAKLSYDRDSDSNILQDGDLWVGYMDDKVKAERTRIYKAYNFGGTIDWAVDLQEFHPSPPSYSGVFKETALTWAQVVDNVNRGDHAGCNRAVRTGSWLGKQCSKHPTDNTNHPVSDWQNILPADRWDQMDCGSAWKDAILAADTCYEGQVWTLAIASFFHFNRGDKCNDMAPANDCIVAACETYNSDKTHVDHQTGACGYEIWNSIVQVHSLLRNFHAAIKSAAENLSRDYNKEAFIAAFAPKRADGSELVGLLLDMLQIPMGMAGGKLLSSAFLNSRVFGGSTSGGGGLLQDVVGALAGLGWDQAKSQIKDATGKSKEVTFSSVFDLMIKSWTDQMDHMVKTLFNGEPKNVELLGKLIDKGRMIKGKNLGTETLSKSFQDQTDQWVLEKRLERPFYLAAIPAAWKANGMNPVLVDFGPSCEIEASRYYAVDWRKYNPGWRCPAGRSYHLASVRDGPPQVCGAPYPGNSCPPVLQWTLDMLDGIEELPDEHERESWGGVTVTMLIEGAVATFEANGGKNIMDAEKQPLQDPVYDAEQAAKGDGVDTKRPGFVRIPICGPDEIKRNLDKGKGRHLKPENYPCDP
ncbi:hypothetical protein RB598_009788 [Gaeumannomyces tritici]